MGDGWSDARWGDLTVLEYGRALRDYQATSGGYARVYGTNGPIGWASEALSQGPSVIVGRKGAYRGVHYASGPFWVIDTAYWVRPTTPIDMRWAYYQLLSQDINGRDSGSAIPSLSRPDFYALQVKVPPLSEQRAIAEVLGALDDKIETNRRFARCCTKLAICQGTDLLSRGEGSWVLLEQVADVSKGVSYRSDDLVTGGGWLVSLKCVGRDGSFQPEGLKPFSGPAKDAQEVEEGDILVAQTDVTQRAEVIGRPLRVERLGFGGRFVASLDFVIVRPHQELTREVLLVLLSQRAFRDHALGYCNGTTVLHMNSRAVPGYQFRLPDADTATGVSVVVQPLLACADVAHREARILAALRDALLPKFLSGELRVHNAESLVKEAV